MADKADIRELAVAAWRLEKWLDNLTVDRKMAAKSALRSIKKYISESGVETKDPVGSKFDPGLAVEVVNNEAEDVPEEELIIVETLSPYIYRNGELIQHARVIIGTAVRDPRVNNGTVREAPTPEPAEVGQKAPEEDLAPSEAGQEDGKTDAVPVTGFKDIHIDPDDIERIMEYAKVF